MVKEEGYTAERVAHKVFDLINWRKEIAGKTQSKIGYDVRET
jgi:hypothetical protein